MLQAQYAIPLDGGFVTKKIQGPHKRPATADDIVKLMKLRYDPEHNIAYLRFRERTEEVETIRVSDELNIDIAPDGTVFEIELLNANTQLRGADNGRFVVVDQTGRETHVPLGDQS